MSECVCAGCCVPIPYITPSTHNSAISSLVMAKTLHYLCLLFAVVYQTVEVKNTCVKMDEKHKIALSFPPQGTNYC